MIPQPKCAVEEAVRRENLVCVARRVALLLKDKSAHVARRCTREWSQRLNAITFNKLVREVRSIVKKLPIRVIARLYERRAFRESRDAVMIAAYAIIERGGESFPAARNLVRAHQNEIGKI